MQVSTLIKNKIVIHPDIPQWKSANWEDYLNYRDAPDGNEFKLFFDINKLLIEMGKEGINHASITRLFSMLFAFWFSRFSEQDASDLGGCLIEKPQVKAAAPDIVLYIGENAPQWKEGESRYINLNQWRVPDLVGEVGDTTIATDLDEKKRIYAALGIPEYWVIDVIGKRVFAFRLQNTGDYQQCSQSIALEGLPISLLEETLKRLEGGTNISAANWFSQAIIKSETNSI